MMLSRCPEYPAYDYRITHELPSNSTNFDLLWLMLCVEIVRDRMASLSVEGFARLTDSLDRLSRYDWSTQADLVVSSADAQVVCNDVRSIFIRDEFLVDNPGSSAVEVHFMTAQGPDHCVTWWEPSILPSFYRQVLYEALSQSCTAHALCDMYLDNLSKTGHA